MAEGRRRIIDATWRVYNAYDTFKREIGEFESSARSTFAFCFWNRMSLREATDPVPAPAPRPSGNSLFFQALTHD